MRKVGRVVLIVLASVVILGVLVVLFWPRIAPWLPRAAWVRAWADYLIVYLHLDRWGLILLLLLVAGIELLVALSLGRASGADERQIQRLERLHAKEAEVWSQEADALREEQRALKARLERCAELLCEERTALWSQFEDVQRRGGLGLDRLFSLDVAEPPAWVRNEWRRIIARLERVDRVCCPLGGDEDALLRQQRADEMLRLGAASFRLGEYEQALTFCVRAADLVPDDPEPVIDQGLIHLVLGRYEAAAGDLDRALKLGESPWAYLYRGLARERLGESRAAMDDYGRAIRLDPGFAQAYHRRGLLYAQAQEHDKALRDQERVVELDRSHARAFAARGAARTALGDRTQGLRDLDKACALAPTDYQVFYTRGRVRRDLEMYDEALADFNRAIQLDSSVAALFLSRADAYFERGEYALAEADYGRALELAPADAGACYGRARARAALREYDAALEDLARALELEPGFALALVERGKAYEALGRHGEALDALNDALALQPDLALGYYQRGLVYGARGEYEQASRDLNKAVELDPSLGREVDADGAAA